MFKIKKELRFGFAIMALILLGTFIMMPAPSQWTGGHLGLLMLALVVVAIMLGFPTAFTLMGMGIMFSWFAFKGDVNLTLNLFVQRTWAIMTNDVLISIPLFVFMGYLVERANLIEKLFKSVHLALARLPGSLAVATLITCAVFATATGIVGAVVTLMGLLAFPAMLRAGYDVRLGAGAITAGGCLGILIPPSVLLIVYGATAGVSVVQLYAGAFFPGLMLAGLYIVYVMILAKLKPEWAPPLPENERHLELPPAMKVISARFGNRALPGLLRSLGGLDGVGRGSVMGNLLAALLPALMVGLILFLVYRGVTAPVVEEDTGGLQEVGAVILDVASAGGVQEPPAEGVKEPGGIQEPPAAEGVREPPVSAGVQEPPGAADVKEGVQEPPGATEPASGGQSESARQAPLWYWITLGAMVAVLGLYYALLNFARLEIFKMLLLSFFPLAILILAVLGSIVFGLATPTEAAAAGAFGGMVMATAYRFTDKWQHDESKLASNRFFWSAANTLRELGPILKESSFLTAKTSAMVCWLFVGSGIFSAAFALLGGQEIIERWVLSMNLTPIQFMLLSQAIIFLLGWPLEWTEIIVIFMPIFIPLLAHFNIDPLFFGLLVALNLQTAFLSPPVAMSAFYLKGVSPPHVTLNQIFAGMMPFMAIQVIAIFLLYMFPAIGLWLPQTLYK
jgi:TRAP-type mannitol/chloroaromatic compound transport system permease large subunit